MLLGPQKLYNLIKMLLELGVRAVFAVFDSRRTEERGRFGGITTPSKRSPTSMLRSPSLSSLGSYIGVAKKPIKGSLGLCSKTAVPQVQSSCFFSSVMLLLMKIPALFQLLSGHTKEYVEKIKETALDSDVDLTPDMCNNPPKDIIDSYKTLSIKGEIAVHKHGGNTTAFLLACLHASGIEIVHLATEGQRCEQGWTPLYTYLKEKRSDLTGDIIAPGRQYSVLQTVTDRDEIGVVEINFEDTIQRNPAYGDILRAIQVLSKKLTKAFEYHVSLKGGIIKLQRQMNADGQHKLHATSFTVCKHKPIVCTWNSCDNKRNAPKVEKKGYEIRSLILLLMKD